MQEAGPLHGCRLVLGAISMSGHAWVQLVECHGLARQLADAQEDLANARATIASWLEKTVIAHAQREQAD